ncbi:MAG: hypothetical protein UY35_C0002G0021 [Candidatus Saccharibacteria bacterium GW2011_GWC2_48_9]|nr:MAG: hypothetical protein UY35_C0002G0021 [Candidatus Saccharibacteria bacterium GW2011_GWC2_48_9]HCH34911.1 hypothetical protein [Candidatus Saccharibacteria bacterium]
MWQSHNGLNQYCWHGQPKNHREINARRQSTISRWSVLETVSGASASLAASFFVCRCKKITTEDTMEYKQSFFSLIERALKFWWWLGIMTIGITIYIDIQRYRKRKIIMHDKALTYTQGTFTVQSTDLPYRNIQSVRLSQGTFGRIFGYGDIVITTANTADNIIFKDISSPQKIRTVIQERIQ